MNLFVGGKAIYNVVLAAYRRNDYQDWVVKNNAEQRVRGGGKDSEGEELSEQGKKNESKINNTKKKEKRGKLFEKQLKLFRCSINQVKRVVEGVITGIDLGAVSIVAELKGLLPKMEKIYDISYRHEILGESVPNREKLFSIYEGHTDIIVKGAREVAFGHKVNLTTGRSNLILDCEIADGNPKDSNLYEGVLARVKSDYGIRPRDMVSDGAYASLRNQEKAKEYGVVNIVFNKIVGSLKNVVQSVHMETRLKKWRSGMEAVISNVKRGFNLFRCDWKGREHFDVKVLWSVIAQKIRVMTGFMLEKLMPSPNNCTQNATNIESDRRGAFKSVCFSPQDSLEPLLDIRN